MNIVETSLLTHGHEKISKLVKEEDCISNLPRIEPMKLVLSYQTTISL